MTINATVYVEDFATPAIAAKMAKVSPRRLGAVIGQSLAEFWRDRLKSLGPNQRGWPSTKFWERAARSVRHQPTEAGVLLVADHQGLRQRWHGGTISAVKAKALTIPISPVSYGKTAADFPGIFLLKTPKGAYLVQSGESVSEKSGRTVGVKKAGGNSSRRIRASLNFLFKLVASVEQEGNDQVVPTPAEFAEVAFARIEEAVA